jgi:PAS domain S-box-containing protein
MSNKPTYKELEQRIEKLEEEAVRCDNAEEARRESEERLSSFMNSASDGMYLLDSKLNFVEINKSGLEVIGKNKEEVIGKNITEIVPNVKDSGRYEKHLEVLKTGRQFEVEDFIPHPVFGDLHFNLISFKAGDGLGIIARDITHRKKALECIERLNNLNEALIIPDSLKGKLKRITDSVVENFEVDFCRIWCTMEGDICVSGCPHADVTEGPHVCRNREYCLHLMSSSGRYTHVDGIHRRVPLGAYKIGRIASGEEDFIINDISTDPEIHDKKWAKEHGLVSFAGYRLLSAHGDVIGVMALFSKKDILPDEHALLKGVANTTAQVIQATVAEGELRKSEARFRGLVESSSDFIWEVDSEGVYTYASPKIKDLLGYEPEEVIGKRPFELMPVEEAGRVNDIFRINAEQGTPLIRLENANQHKKGHHVVLEISGVPIEDIKGNILGYRGIDRDITDRKQAEAALQESEERYRTLISKMLNGFALHEIICDDTGKPIDYRFLEVNSAFEEMTGLKSVEIIGKTVLEVLPETESYWIDTYGEVALTGKSIKFDNYSKAFDKYYEVLAYSPKKGQFAAVFTDITERRKTEQALRFTQFAIDRYSDGAFWMGPDSRVIYVNDAACRSLGYSRDELLKMKIKDFDHDFQEEAWPDHWADLKRRGSIIFDSHHQRKDGTIFPVEISASYVKFGEEEYNCAFARDVSERKKEETEKEDLRNRLQKALRMESIANLAGGVAHQFNNALSPITTNLDLLELDLSDDEDMVKSIEQMRRSAKRMALLTSQLLAYARGGKYSPVIISPSDFVRNTLPLIEHNVHPDVNIDTDLPHDTLPIKCDSTQMQMVLSAVIHNASEAIAGKGRIKITSKNEKIDKTSDYKNEDLEPGLYVSLTIEDNGKGMDEETKNRIFEPFFTTKFQGRGLGMAAVYGIIENHNGFILIDTELGKGTTVRIFLPAIKDKLKDTKDKKFKPIKGKGYILLIEDEEDVMDVSRKLLERLGYSVLEAKTGKEAINIANTFEGKIQLAILDIILPDMGGKAIYNHIMEALPNLKVIVCSGYSINGPAQEILDKGAQGFIQKPLDLQKLSEKLEKVLSK